MYRKQRVRVQPTRSRQIPIGERRKPAPKGKPRYLRVDTVDLGNHDGQAGVYHINAVDTVTQWQAIGCVETISQRYMIPVSEAILHQFAFRILGFHCDNGSEFIKQNVAGMLEKLLVEFTKSRAYRTTDHALVERKNGAVVRKHIGYGFISSDHAAAIQRFYTAHFNPYLNFHRPCGYAVLEQGTRCRTRRVYPVDDYRTPFEKVSSPLRWQQYLKAGLTASLLRQQTGHHGRAIPLVNICSFLLAPVTGLLDGEGGSTAAPFPLDPSLANQSTSKRYSLQHRGHSPLRAHSALESNSAFRLISQWN